MTIILSVPVSTDEHHKLFAGLAAKMLRSINYRWYAELKIEEQSLVLEDMLCIISKYACTIGGGHHKEELEVCEQDVETYCILGFPENHMDKFQDARYCEWLWIYFRLFDQLLGEHIEGMWYDMEEEHEEGNEPGDTPEITEKIQEYAMEWSRRMVVASFDGNCFFRYPDLTDKFHSERDLGLPITGDDEEERINTINFLRSTHGMTLCSADDPDPGKVVMQIDGNPANAELSNLMWVKPTSK